MTTLLLAVAFANEPVPTDLPDEPITAVTMGTVLFDSRLPAEIAIDDQIVAQTYMGAKVKVDLPIGPHVVKVLTNGRPRLTDIEVTPVGMVTVMVGRTGLTTGHSLGAPLGEEGAPTPAQLRVAGGRDVMVRIGDQKYRLDPGGIQDIEIPVGRHPVSVRSGNGTVIWATGVLEVKTTEPLVLQLAEGRMPEVSGSGSVFHPGS